jgi:hypothetical protein
MNLAFSLLRICFAAGLIGILVLVATGLYSERQEMATCVLNAEDLLEQCESLDRGREYDGY